MKFWMCMVEDKGVPKRIHQSLQDAKTECERLVRKESGVIYLLEAVESVRIINLPVKWHIEE